MTRLNFPDPASSPYTENGITYVWNDNGGGANVGFWEANGDAINLQTVTDAGNVTTNGATFAEFQIEQDGQLIVGNGTGNDANTAIAIRNAADDATNIELRYNGSSAFAGNLNINNSNILLRNDGSAQFDSFVGIGESGGGTANPGIFLSQLGPITATGADNANLWTGFQTGSTQFTSRIDTRGRITLSGTTAGAAPQGIQFGSIESGGDVTSQTLDDYEEGTLSPTFQNADGTALTIADPITRYVIVGNFAHVQGTFRFAGVQPADANGFQILNALPTVITINTYRQVPVSLAINNSNNTANAYVLHGSDDVMIRTDASGFASGQQFGWSVSYRMSI